MFCLPLCYSIGKCFCNRVCGCHASSAICISKHGIVRTKSKDAKPGKCGNDGKSGKSGKSGKGGKSEKAGKGLKDNCSAVLYGIEDLRLERRHRPQITPKDVLIKIDTVGICGSDVHYLVHGEIGPFVVKNPMVIGHEASGIVHKVGKEVKHLKKGDRIAIEPGEPCYRCEFCKAGRYNLCPGMMFCATPPYDGNLCQYYKHTADFCYKLPDHLTMEEGALLEPLSVGVSANRRANVSVGSNVLIMGSGPIGLVTMMVAKQRGASKILVTDAKEDRLEVAEELGATYTMKVEKDEKPSELAKKVHECMGSPPNITIDCVGMQSTAQLGVAATATGGTCVFVGMAGGEVKLPMMDALIREVDLRGNFRYCNDYPTALAIASSGKINLKRLVTHHFMMKDTEMAFETARCNYDGAIKVHIHVTKRDANNKTPFDESD